MGGKIVPEIPVKGICPLECFDAGDMLEFSFSRRTLKCN